MVVIYEVDGEVIGMDVSLAAQEGMRLTIELFCSNVVGERRIDDLDEVYTIDARILPPSAR